ncbi:MAG: hypothetical protein APF84_12595 [Gracilibacter sp. BRH_c7a]|nr:MAG: hypothetical protein APF84_12595 [Gracilibacter sp. BRH_c7a]
MNETTQKEMFCGEEYDTYLDENGDKVLYKKKNKNGFEVKITYTGTPEEIKQAKDAIFEFLIKNS